MKYIFHHCFSYHGRETLICTVYYILLHSFILTIQCLWLNCSQLLYAYESTPNNIRFIFQRASRTNRSCCQLRQWSTFKEKVRKIFRIFSGNFPGRLCCDRTNRARIGKGWGCLGDCRTGQLRNYGRNYFFTLAVELPINRPLERPFSTHYEYDCFTSFSIISKRFPIEFEKKCEFSNLFQERKKCSSHAVELRPFESSTEWKYDRST